MSVIIQGMRMALAEHSPQFPPTQSRVETVTHLPRHFDGGVFSSEPNVTHYDFRFSGGRGEDDPLREHDLVGVELDDHEHILWVTEPLHRQKEPLTIVAKPGLGEVIHDGIGYQLHKGIAKRLPEARVLSIATHGIGKHGAELNLSDLVGHTIENMGDETYAFLRKYFPGDPLVLFGLSMGTVIHHHVQKRSIEDTPLNIAGVVDYDPALVDPSRVVADLIGRFSLHMMKGIGIEVVRHTKPCHVLGTLAILGRSRMRLRDMPTLARQAVGLLLGTPVEEIEEMLRTYQTTVIVGEDDPAGQVPMWLDLEAKNIPGFTLHRLKGRGHEIAVQPIDGARKVSKTIVEMGLHPAVV